MTITISQLKRLMSSEEKSNLEFKEAKQQFDSKTLTKCYVAIANEGGGRIFFGISDKMPRKVVGTDAFKNINKTSAQLLDRLSG